jgi:hypothetical protein
MCSDEERTRWTSYFLCCLKRKIFNDLQSALGISYGTCMPLLFRLIVVPSPAGGAGVEKVGRDRCEARVLLQEARERQLVSRVPKRRRYAKVGAARVAK